MEESQNEIRTMELLGIGFESLGSLILLLTVHPLVYEHAGKLIEQTPSGFSLNYRRNMKEHTHEHNQRFSIRKKQLFSGCWIGS